MSPHDRLTKLLTGAYERLLYILLAISPLVAIVYLQVFQSPGLRYEDHPVHQVVAFLAILQSLFVTYVTWRCYLDSGELLLRWLTLAFLGFSVIYLPHGLFTGFAHSNPLLFLLYGPASRLVMNACLLIGALQYGATSDNESRRASPRYWGRWLVIFLLIDVAVAVLANSSLARQPWLRVAMESGALAMALAALAVMVGGRHRMPLVNIYSLGMALFAQSSLTFILALPWNHQWWLAHAISACGFMLLSFGVVRAFHTTRSFSTVYSQEEVIERLRSANEELKRMATTDSLTGIANRRHFLERLTGEQARSQRAGSPYVILAMDLDHFKNINDNYGHQAGDAVLRHITERIARQLRTSDLQGRMGGEEFAALLPDTGLAEGMAIGERICQDIAASYTRWGDTEIRVTISIGVAEFPADSKEGLEVYGRADRRLYAAKHAGRNQVCGSNSH
jgi:diguanylate cyclase (GGDEF)-like protein